MTIEEVIPKKHKKIYINKEEGTLFDYLLSIEGKFGFDVSDCNYEMCCCGSDDEIQGRLSNVLHRINCCDVKVCYEYYSEIADTKWYKIVLNIDIEELRRRKK